MLKVSGKVTNELLEFFAALQKSEAAKLSGRQRLKKMLTSGSELKVFTLKGQDKFINENVTLYQDDYNIEELTLDW